MIARNGGQLACALLLLGYDECAADTLETLARCIARAGAAAWDAVLMKTCTDSAWWRGKRAFMKMFSEARRKRRSVQRRRRVGDRALLVGGPLTLSPNLADSGGAGARILDGALRAWWAVCRWLVV